MCTIHPYRYQLEIQIPEQGDAVCLLSQLTEGQWTLVPVQPEVFIDAFAKLEGGSILPLAISQLQNKL